MRVHLLFLLAFTGLCCRAQNGDSLQTDSTAKKQRHSAAFLSIGGPQNGSADYAYRIFIPKTPWLSADLRLGLGNSGKVNVLDSDSTGLGTGFHMGASAIFFRKWFKLEAGGGMSFSQIDEWYWLVAGLHYEGKKGMLVSLALVPLFSHYRDAYDQNVQLGLGWRF